MAVQVELSRILIRENHQTHVIELREMQGEGRVLPIDIGLYEAYAIERRLAGRQAKRPQTHELLANIVEQMGGAVERVVINDLIHDTEGSGTFLARLYIRQNDKLLDIDSRPSDAITIGIATDVQILVEEHVLEAASKPT